jgi:hypothetical protein
MTPKKKNQKPCTCDANLESVATCERDGSPQALSEYIADLFNHGLTDEEIAERLEPQPVYTLIGAMRYAMGNTAKLVIVCDGGLIQDILSSADIEVAVIDYDCESYDEDALTDIPQTGSTGSTVGVEQAYACVRGDVEVDSKRVEQLFQVIR